MTSGAEERDLRPNTGLFARSAARAIVFLRWLLVPAWVAAAAVAVLYLPDLGGQGRVPLAGLVPADAEAIETQERAFELFGVPLVSNLSVVVRDEGGLSREEQARVAELAFRTDRGETRFESLFAIPIANTLGIFPSSSEEGTTAMTYLFLDPSIPPLDQVSIAQAYAEELEDPQDDAFVGVTGALAARDAESDAIQRALPWIEGATVALIFVILAIAFRSVVAPLVALFAAAIAFLISVHVVGEAASQIDLVVPREVEPLIVVLLLGIVTDYSVFFLSGTRRRLAGGASRVQAAQWTGAQYLPIITTAGLIVALGAATILVGRLDFFRAFGPGLAVTVLIGLAVALTLVPALLAILGRFAFWPSHPDRYAPDEEGEAPVGALRGRVARAVTRRWVAALVVVASLAVLGAGAAGLLRTDLALTPIRGLTGDAQPLAAYRQAAAGFAPGIVAPTEVLVEGLPESAGPEQLAGLAQRLRQQPGVVGVVGPTDVPDLPVEVFATEDGSAARYLAILEDDPYSSHAIDLIQGLDARLPQILARSGLEGAEASLAGDTALAWQSVETVEGDLVRIGIAVVLVNVVLLALFLRSFVAPLYLVLASALAVAAALGLSTFFFHALFGFPDMTYYVPLAAGVLLVSLGADYNLFVVGRIWQEARRRPLRDAIAVAVPRASRAVTIAGVTLALSFSLLAVVPLHAFREFAFIMGVGILLDTFVVRSFLVPGLISLVGRPSWWPGRPREGTALEAG